MKENFIHVCFVIDESGSMNSSTNDVIGGFKKIIDEQKAVENGTCSISLFKFNSSVAEVYRGKDVSEVKELKSGNRMYSWFNGTYTLPDVESDELYCPGGGTAMYDGIGTAIDKIGQWLNDMPENERPSKNLFVIMTDGEENSSTKYNGNKIKDMIKHQEEKYNWTFVYMGTDITTTEYADSIGLSNQIYTTREDISDNYKYISSAMSNYRNLVGDLEAKDAYLDLDLGNSVSTANAKYTSKTGINLNNN